MVSTFTWRRSILHYEGDNWEWDDWPKPIAKGVTNPFIDVTIERRRRLFAPDEDGKHFHQNVRGPTNGDVYEFRNEHDGTYLTVVVAEEQEIVQFRKGRFESVETAAQCSSD